MTTLTHTKTILAGLSVLAILGTTACSSESDAATEQDAATPSAAAEEQTENTATAAVYDFSAVADRETSDELRIEIPEQLLEVAETYREQRLVESVTVSASEDSDAQCAMDLAFEYTDGTVEFLEDDEVWNLDNYFEANGLVHGEYLDDADYHFDDEMRLTAIGHPVVDTAVYDRDLTTVETRCATSPEDFANPVTITFSRLDDSRISDGQYVFTPFGSVDLNMMASGDIHVVNATIEGYHYSGDEHGWLSDRQTVDSQGNVIDR